MSVPLWRFAAVLTASVAAATLALAAPANDDCLACHDDAGITAGDGRSVTVSAKPFADSVHGPLSCIDCHADLAHADLPHPEKLAKVDCAVCHADPVSAYGKSVHAEARRNGNSVAATCIDCHGKHDIRPSTDPASPTYGLHLPATCGKCHGDPKVIAAGKIRIGDVVTTYHDSIHGKALEKSGLVVSAKCTDCHGNHEIRRKSDPGSGVFRANVPATCGKCHEGIRAQYASGVHGTKLAAGNPNVPVCSDCHTAHHIERTDADRWKLDVLAECGSCHAQSLKTYRDTFHGQVTSLGFARVASCADCHGAHAIFPKTDPRSTISGEHRVETCRKCHAGAGASFARYDPHADKRDADRNPPLYWTARFMQLLLGGVFVFFGLHTSLWFQRLLRGDPPPKPPKPLKPPKRKDAR
ncbi:MAG TPA: cytochrome c3 family protein [Candidatus Polarisedimenticolaceae bacterium]|nr:cytochrome c3 family protein [Candidatus Polarisedimenticolaceae bacterium]